ncbi:class I SAM-dependent methyltransferase [Streptomyces sp. NBC_00876]|uniref:class I SAM-dependent methyltransferase n=1 Tax=Streptomyces sp. NBC_00876 TaxID=2975853 RepID=UPI003864A8A5|nr:class I SAM-dependent methyltransferase [Streptomyces sp. NBC_00876]
MTPTLVRNHRPAEPSAPADGGSRARDWAEIQERMLAPLYEAVYQRLEVGPATRMLSLGCGSGLALLIAARRGARVTGVDTDPERLALARVRLQEGPQDGYGSPAAGPRLLEAVPAAAGGGPYDLITAFTPIGCAPGDDDDLVRTIAAAAPVPGRGSTVVLTGWGPPERCATEAVLRVATRLAECSRAPRTGGGRGARRDDLEDVAFRSGLKPDGSGRVACPFGYADMDSAVRGLLSTRLFDAAVRATDRFQVEKEVAEALHPHRRRDGTVWMPNVFRYLVCTA